jgi:Tol biopolymer transport system component
MNHHALRLAAWPCFAVIACVLLVAGCQDGSGPGLITSPEGKPAYEGAKPPPPPPPPADPAIAFTTQGRERSKSYSYLKVMNADGTNVTTILRSEYIQSGAINGPISWAPGGGSIAFVRSVSGLWLIDVTVVNGVPTGSNTRLLVPRTSGSIFNPAWSPLGDRIAFTRSSRNIEAVPVTGGEPVQLYASPGTVGRLAWSPDARKIAFRESGMIRVLNLDDGSVTAVLEQDGNNVSWGRMHDVLAFDRFDAEGYLRETCTMQLPDGTPTFICAGNLPDWSPDDQYIVFHLDVSLFKVEVATGIITWLTGGEATYPAWRR